MNRTKALESVGWGLAALLLTAVTEYHYCTMLAVHWPKLAAWAALGVVIGMALVASRAGQAGLAAGVTLSGMWLAYKFGGAHGASFVVQMLTWPVSGLIGVGSAVMARRICGGVPAMGRLRDVAVVLVVTGIGGGLAISVWIQAETTLIYPGETTKDPALYTWLSWMTCTVFPLAVVAVRESLRDGLRRSAWEYVLNLGAIVLVLAASLWVFRQEVRDWRAVAYPMIPCGILLLSAVLIGPRTTALVAAAMGLVTSTLTGMDSGPFSRVLPSGNDHIISAYLFTLISSATMMLIAAAVSERGRLAREVEASRQRLELAVVGSNVGIWDWNVQTGHSRLEGGLPEILGETSWTEDPDFWEQRLHPDDRERVKARLSAHMERDEPYEVEYRLRTIDGDYRWFRSRGRAVRDASGRVLRMLGTIADITDRHATEEALRQSEERYRVLVEGVRTIVWEVDVLTFRFTFVSGAAEQILGYPLSEWYTKNFWRDHIHPEDRDRAVEFCAQKTRQGQEHTLEYRMIAADGRVVWIQDLATVVMKDGRPSALRGVMLDITARKEAELELERFFNLSPAMLCVARDGRFLNVNPAMCEALGYSSDELRSRPYVDFVHPEDAAATRAETDSLARGRHTYRFENRYLHADGRYRWLLWSANPITPDGKVYAAAQDITERKLAEVALAESERRFRIIAESIDQVFWITTSTAQGQRRAVYISPAFERVWGMPREALEHNLDGWLRTIVEEDLAAIRESVQAAERDPAGTFDVVYRIRRGDGRIRRIHDRGRVVRDELSGELRQIGIAEDITEKYEAQQALVRSEAANAALIAAIPDLLFRVSRDGRYLDYSGPADAILAAPPGEFIGKTLREVLPPDRAESCMENLEKAFATGVAQTYEYEAHDARGGRRFWEVRVVRCSDREALLLVRNITDRRRAELELRRAKEQYRLLVERLPLVVYTAGGGAAEPTYVGPQFFEITGLPPERMLGGRELFNKNIHPDDRARVETALAGLTRPGDSSMVEYRLRRPDGRELWLREQAAVVAGDAAGSDPVVHGLIQDITSAKRAEEALRDNQRRLALLVNQSPFAVIVWNTRFEITQWNPAAERIFGYSADEAVGRHAELIIPQSARGFVDTIWRQLVSRRGGSHAINENLTKHGKCIICEWRNSPLLGPDGSVVGVSSFVQDVTERVNADRRQALMMRELDHRVKNNMAAVLSLAEQTGRTAGSIEKFNATFTGRVRALARLHTALASSHWNGADLHESVRQAVEPYGGEEPGRLTIDGPKVLLPPRVAQSLTMALNELATNAFKYGALSRPGGRVEVSWSVDGPPTSPDALSLAWLERDGPPAVQPERRGFGMDLIDGAITYQIRGSVTFAFPSAGFECRLTAPLHSEEATPDDDPPARQKIRLAENPY
ncbi:MAG: PAS domain S-box protein [Phycisphaerales bacterium]